MIVPVTISQGAGGEWQVRSLLGMAGFGRHGMSSRGQARSDPGEARQARHVWARHPAEVRGKASLGRLVMSWQGNARSVPTAPAVAG